MLVKDIVLAIEDFAPAIYQESYDNCGLQIGDMMQEVTAVLISLDVTEAIIDEALLRGCNMIVAHHPLIFTGIKSISGRTYVERTIIKAIKNDISIYAAHTNLDNIAHGVNAKIAEKLGLMNTRVLAPKTNLLSKLYTYVPVNDAEKVRNALFTAGAGSIGRYEECSFITAGTGTFKPGADTSPAIGTAGGSREEVAEVKIEVLIDKGKEGAVIRALMDSHPYEEVAYEVIPITNAHQEIGAGMIGKLPEPMTELDFMKFLKYQMRTEVIRHTGLLHKSIQKVAVCGGSGSFLLRDAIRAGAGVLVTADYKYHQFFDAEGRIIIADIGHYESEQFTAEIFQSLLNKKFPNFATLLSNLSTNPVKYFY